MYYKCSNCVEKILITRDGLLSHYKETHNASPPKEDLIPMHIREGAKIPKRKPKRKKSSKKRRKSETEVKQVQEEADSLINEKDKQIEDLTREYNEIAGQYQATQQQQEEILDQIMLKIEAKKADLPTGKERPKTASVAKADNTLSISQVQETLFEYLEKRFNQVDEQMHSNMCQAIIEAHSKKKEDRKHEKKSKRGTMSKEVTESYTESLSKLPESRRSLIKDQNPQSKFQNTNRASADNIMKTVEREVSLADVEKRNKPQTAQNSEKPKKALHIKTQPTPVDKK